MADLEYASVIIPVLLSIAASVGLFALTRFSKTSEGTLTGTVKIAHVELTVQGLEKRLDERLGKIEDLLRYNEVERRQDLAKVYERLEKIETESRIHGYRLDQMDRQSGRNSNE